MILPIPCSCFAFMLFYFILFLRFWFFGILLQRLVSYLALFFYAFSKIECNRKPNKILPMAVKYNNIYGKNYLLGIIDHNQPGGNWETSTTSEASLVGSVPSSTPSIGVLGNAIIPDLANSKIPNG